MKFILTCPYNTGQAAKKELDILGYKAVITSPTSLEFTGDEIAIARVNINSRIGNKLFLVLQQGDAFDFPQLFDLIHSIDRTYYIGPNQPIHISANSKNSQINSIPTIQSIAKKAITKKLLGNDDRWNEDTALPEISITITIDRDLCYVLLNTSGESLHERGYRQHAGAAPLKENLAAALILSSGRKFSTPLVDPFCGAGTISIEAALIAKNIAPGLMRAEQKGFSFQRYDWYDKALTGKVVMDAEDKIMLDREHTIIGYDIDPTMIEIAKDNAKNAGVEKYIQFSVRDFLQTPIQPEQYNKQRSLLTNPPYGERLQVAESMRLYSRLLSIYEDSPDVNGGFITNAPDVHTLYNYRMWKETRYFNGPIECTFYKIARL